MKQFEGEVRQVWLAGGAETRAVAGRILSTAGSAPAPGQFMLADASDEDGSALAVALFAGGFPQEGEGWAAAPPLPPAWTPGTRLRLLGPIGRGFSLPAAASRVALAALGDTPARLLPLAGSVLARGGSVALLCAPEQMDAALRELPPAVEVAPLDGLPDLLAWADFLALDVPAHRLADLRALSGMPQGSPLPCAAQALVTVRMPCAGLGECGACAVRARYGFRLACKDGPVFDLNELSW